VQAAVDWVLAFGDQPGMDEPIDHQTGGMGGRVRFIDEQLHVVVGAVGSAVHNAHSVYVAPWVPRPCAAVSEGSERIDLIRG
jgi:hypothetical protein